MEDKGLSEDMASMRPAQIAREIVKELSGRKSIRLLQ